MLEPLKFYCIYFLTTGHRVLRLFGMKKMPNKYRACLIIRCISTLLNLSTGLTNNDQQLLAELTWEHQAKCPAKYFTASCEFQQGSIISTDCCGYCSCAADCKRYGDCCLSQYNTFSQGSDTVANSTYVHLMNTLNFSFISGMKIFFLRFTEV